MAYTHENLSKLSDSQLRALAAVEAHRWDLNKVNGRKNQIQMILSEQNISNTLVVYQRRVLDYR